MSFLGGGAECGPSNPLATLGKRLGSDSGVQRDRYAPGAGPSSIHAPMRQQQQQQQQGQGQGAAPDAFFARPQAYDMGALQHALPHHLHPQHPDAQRAAFEHSFRSGAAPVAALPALSPGAAPPAWAQDFLKAGVLPEQQQQQPQTQPQQSPHSPSTANPLQRPAYSAQYSSALGAMQWHAPPPQAFAHSMHAPFHADSPHAAVHAAATQVHAQKQHAATAAEPAWVTAFAAFDQQGKTDEEQPQPLAEEPKQQQRPLNTVEDADELAQTAGRLMETIAHEEDAKFKQSRFLDLMRRLRDREAGIEGTDIVAKDPSAAAPAAATYDAKGKGRALPETAIEEYQTRLRQQYTPSQRGMDLAGPASTHAPSADALAEMNDLWAEEDAAREEHASRNNGAFVGDAGDIAARMAEDDAAAREFEKYQRLGAQMPGAHSADWREAFRGGAGDEIMDDEGEGIVGTGTDVDAFTSYVPRHGFGTGSSAFSELRRAAMREPLVEHPHPQAGSSAQQGEIGLHVEPGGIVEDAQQQQQQEKEEEEDGIKSTDDFVGRKWDGPTGRGRPGVQTAEWDALQRDWDEFEATSMGIRPVSSAEASAQAGKQRSPSFSQFTNTKPSAYRFAPNNPYLGRTRNHFAHWEGLHRTYEAGATASGSSNVLEDSVLEREAAVQDDPTNAQAWYDLGVKQQENEREGLAISALHRAVQLDPQMQGAWLALAVSYTNENDRPAALEAIVRWMDSVGEYKDVLAAHRAEVAEAEARAQAQAAQQQQVPRDGSFSPISSGSLTPDGLTASAKHQRVTEALIALARHGSTQGRLDADVQVALGVLFNASEDYDKAVDCFGAALSVRPEDWLLYNRMGATLSNSGRSDEAIRFYHHALKLQPEFVRCHFNLSISYLNLKMYRETAQHVYTALNLQRAESAASSQSPEMQQLGKDREPGGVASGSLWETFRVSLELMNRPDLARLCARRDIDLFDPNDFIDHNMAEA